MDQSRDDRLDAGLARRFVNGAELRDVTVLLTGGSAGIGEAAVRRLHECGASVFFTYLKHQQAALALVDELRDRIGCARVDVGNPDELPGLVHACLERFGHLDVLVNNAAVFEENPFEGSDYQAWRRRWQRTFDINLFGAANLAWLAIHQMRKQGQGGRVINVVSRAAHRGELTFADYGASKAALNNLTKSIARSCAKDGIVAMAVAPGFIETEMAALDLQTRRAQIEGEIPLGRVGTPQEVAHVIAFLASPNAQHLNGATIDVNGGSYVR